MAKMSLDEQLDYLDTLESRKSSVSPSAPSSLENQLNYLEEMESRKPETQGWSGVGEDVAEVARDIASGAGQAIMHPWETTKKVASEVGGAMAMPFLHPLRTGQNLLQGGINAAQGTFNLGPNVYNYLQKKGITPAGSKAPTIDINLRKLLGQEEKNIPGDVLMTGLTEYGLSPFNRLGAGKIPAGAGKLAQAAKISQGAGAIRKFAQPTAGLALHEVGQNRNPLTPAAIMVGGKAAQLGKKAIGAGWGFGKEQFKDLISTTPENVAEKAFEGLLPSEVPQMLETIEASKRVGVPLTPAEASGNPFLKKTEQKLGIRQKHREKYYEEKLKRQAAEPQAINKFLNQIAETDANFSLGDVRKVSDDILKKQAKGLQIKADPDYKAAYKKKLYPAQMKELFKDANMKNAIQTVKIDPVYGPALEGYKLSDFKVLDLAQRELYSLAEKEGGYRGSLLHKSHKKMLEMMDKISPEFKRARKIYSDIETVNKLRNDSPLGKIAQLSDMDLHKMGETILNPKRDIKELIKVRNMMSEENPQIWRQFMRKEIADRLETKAVGKESKYGTNFYNKIIKDPKVFQRILAGLGDKSGKHNAAQQRLKDMKLALKNLNDINEPGGVLSELSKPTSLTKATVEALQFIFSGKKDQAIIDMIFDENWTNRLPENLRSKYSNNKIPQGQKLIEALEEIS